MNDLQILLLGSLSLGAPLILAAMGGYTSERGGVINIALEGKMLAGAAVFALIAQKSGSAVAGVAAAIAAAALMSLLHWMLTQSYRIDHIVSGMAINAIAFGGTNFLDKKFTDTSAAKPPLLPIEIYYAVALLLPFALALYARRTRGGLRLLAVGSDPGKARQMGVFPKRIRLVGLLATGVFCGIAGSLLVTTAGYFTDGMTAGKGFIALAALIIGGWRPIPAMLAALAFGLFQGLQIRYQGEPFLGMHVPRELWLSLPYIVTVIALAGFLGKSRAPAGLGKP
jgi:general nucleoside transport system permease protein